MERDDAVLTHTFGRVGDSAACVLFGRAFRCVRVGVLPWEHHREHESRSNEKRVQCHIYSPTHANNPSAHRPTLPLVLPTPPNLLGSRTFDWSATTYVLHLHLSQTSQRVSLFFGFSFDQPQHIP